MRNNRELFWFLFGAVLGMIALAIEIERRKPNDQENAEAVL